MYKLNTSIIRLPGGPPFLNICNETMNVDILQLRVRLFYSEIFENTFENGEMRENPMKKRGYQQRTRRSSTRLDHT